MQENRYDFVLSCPSFDSLSKTGWSVFVKTVHCPRAGNTSSDENSTGYGRVKAFAFLLLASQSRLLTWARISLEVRLQLTKQKKSGLG